MASKLASQPDEFGNTTTSTPGNSGQVPWGWSNGNGNAGGNSGNTAGGTVFEKDQYFFHPDHLGSSSYVTDVDGEIFQHIEYFPFGETWVEESSNTQRSPYLFTGKELDEETGLYYFGARYYDPRTSVWQSPDPILAAYLTGEPAGGVYVPANLNLYGYVQQKPIIAKDPDGQYTLNDALNSLYEKSVEPDSWDELYGYDMPNYSDTQIFEEWLALEKSDTVWNEKVPLCPAICSPEEGFVPEGGENIWEPLKNVEGSAIAQKFHAGAVWEMRSAEMENGSGNQCIYNSSCNVMTNIPAAGSADRASPSNQSFGGYLMGSEGHYAQDVLPFNLADELGRGVDYYLVRPILAESE